MREELLKEIDALEIPYRLLRHAPAHTAQDCEAPAVELGCMIPINLFLRPRRQEVYYLLLTVPFTRLNTSSVSRQAGSPRLGFASDEELWKKLRVRSGSATPLSFLYPESGDVTLLMDRRLQREAFLGFHLGENDATLAMAVDDLLQRFLPHVGKTPVWVDMEENI